MTFFAIWNHKQAKGHNTKTVQDRETVYHLNAAVFVVYLVSLHLRGKINTSMRLSALRNITRADTCSSCAGIRSISITVVLFLNR